jgi:hypothetical protein
MLQKILAPLITELRALTWDGWIVNGKPGNPFVQVSLSTNQQSIDSFSNDLIGRKSHETIVNVLVFQIILILSKNQWILHE